MFEIRKVTDEMDYDYEVVTTKHFNEDMTAEEALQLSIDKWSMITDYLRKNRRANFGQFDYETCALCFYHGYITGHGCGECPLYLDGQGCDYDADSYWYKWNRERNYQQAKGMLSGLKRLQKEVE